MPLASGITAALQRVASEIKTLRTEIAAKGNVSSTTITKIEKVTQAQYNNITTKDPNTLYVIVG